MHNIGRDSECSASTRSVHSYFLVSKAKDKNRRLISGDEAIVICQHGRHVRLTWTDGLIGRGLWRDYHVVIIISYRVTEVRYLQMY